MDSIVYIPVYCLLQQPPSKLYNFYSVFQSVLSPRAHLLYRRFVVFDGRLMYLQPKYRVIGNYKFHDMSLVLSFEN